MSTDFTQLDELIESDVLEALGEEAPHMVVDNAGGGITDIPDELASLMEDDIDNTETEDENIIDDIEIADDDTAKENTPEEDIIPNSEDNIVDDSSGETLDDIGDIEILPMAEIESALDEQEEFDTPSETSMESGDLAMLLSKLLNNKTIEITIKIKD